MTASLPIGAPGDRRVALVVTHLKGGGKEECVVNLANRLTGDGWQPTVVCLGVSGRLEARVDAGVELVALHKSRGNDLRAPLRLAAVLRSRAIRIVHSHNWGALVESVVGARLAGVRSVVHTQHGLDYGFGERPPAIRVAIRRLARRIASRAVGRIAVVSEEVRRAVVAEWGVPDDRVHLIHNGIDVPPARSIDAGERLRLRASLGLRAEDFVFGSAGYFRPVKDFPTLIESLARLLPVVPSARLVLFGAGPCQADVDRAVDRWGLQQVVRLPGWRPDLAAVLPALDAFVLSSLSEGLSIALLEAMGAGLPVVATNVGGNPEIVDQGRTGWLVPPRAPGEMAGALAALAASRGRREEMGRAGRSRLERCFSLGRMTGDYEALYARVAG
jgi:sugar transferase (PEP-CTERM/EpsH1 system associated)